MDLAEASFMVQGFRLGLDTSELLALRIRQLERLKDDVDRASKTLRKARFVSKAQFERKFARQLTTNDYKAGQELTLDPSEPLPAYTPSPRGVSPAPYHPHERGPADIFPYTEPTIRPVPPVSRAPSPRDLPRSRRSAPSSHPCRQRYHEEIRRVIPPPPPATGSLRRDRSFDIERLIYMQPFLRDTLRDVRPDARLVPLDAPGQEPAFQVDGFRENLYQYTVDFTRPLARPLVSGQRVNIWGPEGTRLGDLVVMEDLRPEHGDTNLLAYWILPPRITPVVVKVPQVTSQVLSRQDLFLTYEIGINPTLVLEEIMHRTDVPERWNHIFNNTRRYTLGQMLRESGREDLLAELPEWVWGVFVAPPEGQLTTRLFLYALSTPARQPE
ncbi:hypothetical protein FB107DRAFT_279923 [Schizophyllum commune]